MLQHYGREGPPNPASIFRAWRENPKSYADMLNGVKQGKITFSGYLASQGISAHTSASTPAFYRRSMDLSREGETKIAEEEKRNEYYARHFDQNAYNTPSSVAACGTDSRTSRSVPAASRADFTPQVNSMKSTSYYSNEGRGSFSIPQLSICTPFSSSRGAGSDRGGVSVHTPETGNYKSGGRGGEDNSSFTANGASNRYNSVDLTASSSRTDVSRNKVPEYLAPLPSSRVLCNNNTTGTKENLYRGPSNPNTGSISMMSLTPSPPDPANPKLASKGGGRTAKHVAKTTFAVSPFTPRREDALPPSAVVGGGWVQGGHRAAGDSGTVCTVSTPANTPHISLLHSLSSSSTSSVKRKSPFDIAAGSGGKKKRSASPGKKASSSSSKRSKKADKDFKDCKEYCMPVGVAVNIASTSETLKDFFNQLSSAEALSWNLYWPHSATKSASTELQFPVCAIYIVNPGNRYYLPLCTCVDDEDEEGATEHWMDAVTCLSYDERWKLFFRILKTSHKISQYTFNIKSNVRPLFTVLGQESQRLHLSNSLMERVSRGHIKDLLTAFWITHSDGIKKPDSDKKVDISVTAIAEHFKVSLEGSDDPYRQAFGEIALYKQLHIATQVLLFKNGMYRAYVDVELPTSIILSHMESSGVSCDETVLHTIASAIIPRVAKLESDAHAMAGSTFCLSSPQQPCKVLYDDLNLECEVNTEKGNRSSNVEALVALSSKHPLPKLILEYRGLMKITNTYCAGYLPLVTGDVSDRRIHPSWNQYSTATGRLSCNSPNLQQLPGDDSQYNVRNCIKCTLEGEQTLLVADYSQIEMRIMCHFSRDLNLQSLFTNQRSDECMDVYKLMAKYVFKLVDVNDCTDDQRSICKIVVLGLCYGLGAKEMAKNLRKSVDEATTLKKIFFSAFPGIREFIANTKKSATEKGFVVTISKRRREIEKSEVDRQAVNSIIQGSAADIMKKAIIEISSKLHAMVQRDHLTEPGSVPTIICQVHDELLIETPCSKDLYIEVLKIVKEAMENTARQFFGVSVPIPVNFKVGTKYGSLRSIPSPALLGT